MEWQSSHTGRLEPWKLDLSAVRAASRVSDLAATLEQSGESNKPAAKQYGGHRDLLKNLSEFLFCFVLFV